MDYNFKATEEESKLITHMLVTSFDKMRCDDKTAARMIRIPEQVVQKMRAGEYTIPPESVLHENARTVLSEVIAYVAVNDGDWSTSAHWLREKRKTLPRARPSQSMVADAFEYNH